MRTLIFNGSPHRHGDTTALVDAMLEELRGETTLVSPYFDDLQPCVDCRACWVMPGCAIKDGMREVYRCVETYDNIVIASPLYFSELTGPLLSVMSRLQTYYAGRMFRRDPVRMTKKHGVLILTGGGDGGPERAIATADTLFRFMNARCVARVFSLYTNDHPAAADEPALKQARQAGELLNRNDGICDSSSRKGKAMCHSEHSEESL